MFVPSYPFFLSPLSPFHSFLRLVFAPSSSSTGGSTSRGVTWRISFVGTSGNASAVSPLFISADGGVSLLPYVYTGDAATGYTLSPPGALLSTSSLVTGWEGFEQQRVTLDAGPGASPAPVSGSFSLTFDGRSTGPITANVSADGLVAALLALGNTGTIVSSKMMMGVTILFALQ